MAVAIRTPARGKMTFLLNKEEGILFILGKNKK
jgi:hypothetical protein